MYTFATVSMSTKKTTVLMAAVLAVATVLAAGLIVLPGSVQEAQANPCSINQDVERESPTLSSNGDQDCDLTGYFEFDED